MSRILTDLEIELNMLKEIYHQIGRVLKAYKRSVYDKNIH